MTGCEPGTNQGPLRVWCGGGAGREGGGLEGGACLFTLGTLDKVWPRWGHCLPPAPSPIFWQLGRVKQVTACPHVKICWEWEVKCSSPP